MGGGVVRTITRKLTNDPSPLPQGESGNRGVRAYPSSPGHPQRNPHRTAAASTPAMTSSAISPKAPCWRSAQPTGPGLAMSNARNSRNASSTPSQGRPPQSQHGDPLAGELVDHHPAGIALDPRRAHRQEAADRRQRRRRRQGKRRPGQQPCPDQRRDGRGDGAGRNRRVAGAQTRGDAAREPQHGRAAQRRAAAETGSWRLTRARPALDPGLRAGQIDGRRRATGRVVIGWHGGSTQKGADLARHRGTEPQSAVRLHGQGHHRGRAGAEGRGSEVAAPRARHAQRGLGRRARRRDVAVQRLYPGIPGRRAVAVRAARAAQAAAEAQADQPARRRDQRGEGATIVPLQLHFNERGVAKVLLAIAEGRKSHDKRAAVADRDWQRDKARLLRARG